MKNAFLILLAAFLLPAQQPSAPPPVLRIFHEDIKEGKGGAHQKTEGAFMRTATKENYPAHILGMASMTGTAQAIFLEGHDTFASIADSQGFMDKPEFGVIDAADAEVRINQRSMIALYRPDLSYGADKIDLPKMRYFSIETVRVREGHRREYSELVKMLVGAAEKSSDTQLVATYEVLSGAPDGTFLVMEPSASLKSMDVAQQHQQAFVQAMGESGMQPYSKLLSESVASDESILYAVDPAMSYMPKEWAKADPDFWGPKTTKITKAPAAKTASK